MAAARGNAAAGFEAGGGGFADIFEEMFGEFMGGRRGQQARQRGGDLRYNMEITLEEALCGQAGDDPRRRARGLRDLLGQRRGKGLQAHHLPDLPRLRARSRHSQGFFTVETTCGDCHGAGKIIDKPCRACSGQGRARQDKTLNVTIPPGVEDGTRIRLAGEGEAGVRRLARGRSLHLPLGGAAQAVPARGRQYLLPRSHHHG